MESVELLCFPKLNTYGSQRSRCDLKVVLSTPFFESRMGWERGRWREGVGRALSLSAVLLD